MQEFLGPDRRRFRSALLLLAVLTAVLVPSSQAAASPSVTTVAQLKAGAVNLPVTLHGSGFASGVTVTSLAYDLHVTGVKFVNSTTLTMVISSDDGASLGLRKLRIKNLDASTVTCSCVNLVWAYRVATTPTRPNIVLINTDDQRWDSISQLPLINARTDWARFSNSFVHEPQCCPSRASLFSGQYVYHHQVTTLREGGRLNDATTLATMLHGAGYQTQLAGKYLNGYPFGSKLVPPGWDDFRAFDGPNPAAPHGADGVTVGYPYVNTDSIENGVVTKYRDAPKDYTTDRWASQTRNFMRKADPNRPIFSYFAPVAPHFTVHPADRHKASCATTPLPDRANFNAHDRISEPGWMADDPGVPAAAMHEQRLGTCRTLQSVDEAVNSLFTELKASGRLDNTYVIFTSDNGYMFGEHRLSGKGNLYEESVRVPLLIRGPGVKAGTLTRLTSNVDLAPTLTQIAGAPVPSGFFDGHSFLDDLKGTNNVPNPSEVLLFGCRTQSGPASFCGGHVDHMGEAWGIRTATYKYIEYAQSGETQLFNEVNDPFELSNRTNDPTLQATKTSLANRLHALIAKTATLRGRVTDKATGLPIAGIVVQLQTVKGSHIRDMMTDKDGRWAALPLVLGSYRLRFMDPSTPNQWLGNAPTAATSTSVSAVSGTTTVDAALVRTSADRSGAAAAPSVPIPEIYYDYAIGDQPPSS